MRFILSLFLVAFLAAPVLAAKDAPKGEENAQGGYEGPVRSLQTETVDKLAGMPEDSTVRLLGNVIASLEGEKDIYIFKDATGEIPVVIKPGAFKKHKINDKTKVRIVGKIIKPANAPNEVHIRVSRLDPVE